MGLGHLPTLTVGDLSLIKVRAQKVQNNKQVCAVVLLK